ncbi:NAD-dependent epimerase [Dickeya poaceiphila]|uniref:NAD-dependent epimerase n=1 Tax=Dickeya poaceiphila TaxID=568768 RepID=A0A5B8HPH8_9GAMM|nr:NAD-dependent epimerase [Dickeya poaceiphila]QDX30579.1 NAD-dependent epimerase [Dickeya poaceiphila]
MKFLVTGAAGFIGLYTCQSLCAAGHTVVGIDNLNSYYDVSLKEARLAKLRTLPGFRFEQIDIVDSQAMAALFAAEKFERVIHLAAQAGVRYSLENPMVYAQSNLIGHLNVLEGCRHHDVGHLIYASSSSVYGLNSKTPFATTDSTDHPISLYAATKKSNELMAHSYSHLYGLPVTGLRFFTVYGPWGRPDMALFKFTRNILAGEPIDIYNRGDMWRDFTYVTDIVEGVLRVVDKIPERNAEWAVENGSSATSSAPYRLYNIGHGSPVRLMDFVTALESALGREAVKNFMPMQAGDVYQTYADTSDLFAVTGYRPQVGVEDGVRAFVDWYQDFYQA